MSRRQYHGQHLRDKSQNQNRNTNCNSKDEDILSPIFTALGLERPTTGDPVAAIVLDIQRLRGFEQRLTGYCPECLSHPCDEHAGTRVAACALAAKLADDAFRTFYQFAQLGLFHAHAVTWYDFFRKGA